MYEWAGVDPETGDAQWYYTDDETGERLITTNYGSLDSNDKVKVGNSLPKVSGGFQSDLTWRDLSLSMSFAYAIGNKIYNRDKASLMGVNGANGSTMSKDLLNRWTTDNRYTDIPRLEYEQNSYFTRESTRWLVNGSYLRLKTITLNYNLPKQWIQPAMLKEVSVYIQGENLLTFSKQQGLDPEQAISGVTYWRYPAMKTISFGINVKL